VAQVYSDTGEFNATSRLKTAIKSNLLLYAIGFVILILFLVVYLVQNSFKAAYAHPRSSVLFRVCSVPIIPLQ
jgi:sensor domain CHASE-containing protein